MSDYIDRQTALDSIESAGVWGWSKEQLYDEMQAVPSATVPTIDLETLPIVQELRKKVETLSEGVANLSDNLRMAYLQRDELQKKLDKVIEKRDVEGSVK